MPDLLGGHGRWPSGRIPPGPGDIQSLAGAARRRLQESALSCSPSRRVRLLPFSYFAACDLNPSGGPFIRRTGAEPSRAQAPTMSGAVVRLPPCRSAEVR